MSVENTSYQILNQEEQNKKVVKMIVSIINARFKPTNFQIRSLYSFFKDNDKDTTYLVGMDAADVAIVEVLTKLGLKVEGRPQTKASKEFIFPAMHTSQPLAMKDRNAKLVEEANLVLGVPQTMNELEDSPCWKTIRSAITLGKDVTVISPTGFLWDSY